MSRPWPYPGARWWKFDFHTHTPASKDTKAWQGAIGTPDALMPQAWLLKYMAAGIDCVAITDHNSGEWVDKLKASYADMKRQADDGSPPAGFRELHLFPGVEISVQGGFHLLAIFDPSATSQTISDLLAKVDYDGTRGDSDGATREGAAKVVEQVLSAGGLAIPVHVERDKGPWQVDLQFGSRFTWVKMASPSLEGLRLALLDGQGVSVRRSDDGEAFQPFDLPEHFIECIEVHKARAMGLGRTAARLPLNPYFNALIGGRGTGKSTFVHALRLAYRRERELAAGTEAGQTFSRFNKVAKGRNDEGGLKADTAISVQVHRDGHAYRLHWRQDGQPASAVEELEPGGHRFQPASSQAITPQRFPIRLFSQGQIAALAGESQQALLNVIDDAAGTAEQQHALAEARRTFLATRAQMRDLDGKLGEREALNLSLQDVQRKLARFEGADHATVLKDYQRTSRQAREVERQFEQASELVERMQTFAIDMLADDLPDGLFDAEVSPDASAVQTIEKLHAAIGMARSALECAAADLDQQRGQLKAALGASDWADRGSQAKAAYDVLKADLQQQGVSDPSEYGRLVQERQRLETEAKRLDALHKQRDELKNRASGQLEAVRAARKAVTERRARFLQRTLEGNPFVRMTLIPYGRDPRAIERSLRELLGTAEGRYTDDLLVEDQQGAPAKGAVAELLSATDLTEQPGAWDTPAIESSLNELKRKLVATCAGQNEFGSWFNKFLQAEADRRAEYIDHILCWFPEDGLRVEYSRKGDGRDFQSIGQASAGQRAAAMLAFLLAHGTEPLVLDQPEDDLDNHLIYSLVVQQIRANKLRRQLIIVTHNPNIVVNGDAELIHVLDFHHQCYVKQTGSLQDLHMREEVCQVMEGGKEAFERRYQRLGREI